MSKEVVIRYKVDSKGTLTLFEVVRSDFNRDIINAPVRVNPDYLFTFWNTLYLHPNMEKPTMYKFHYKVSENTLLIYITEWRIFLNSLGYSLVCIKDSPDILFMGLLL